MTAFLKTIARDQQGATAVEYGLILALVFLAMLGAVRTFGQNAIAMWDDLSIEITEASKKNN
ncbi:Flp family type IVb pilin [Qipengyuania spongiae]|uniref:Flp family type IVb pilin n=1 Tax=Qipengyuania spongiae TaxID=2909673 RepID=A0ABY5SY26_9SPHN|nr:Flp family type IVb pilin [Qipengyuania spongiae]UVI39134.1 Flp family type IVb pilin [Qipengyuania spongiae]